MENENILKNDEKSTKKVEKVMSEKLTTEKIEAKTLPNEDKSNIEMVEETEKLTIPDFKKLLGCG
jgi:hypothetical protein